MRPGPAAIAGLLLGLALIFSACGGGETTAAEEGATARDGSSAASTTATRRGGCRGQLRSVVGRLDQLRDNLVVGLSYDAYLEEVEAVRAAYAAIPTGRLSLACLTLAGTPVEEAVNQYIAGVNTWGDCLATAGCEPTSIEAELKRRWNVASDRLSEAEDGMRKTSAG
jgi:hypothetical protein